MFKGNDYICSVPFSDLEIMEGYNHMCCGTWLPKTLPKKTNLLESWYSNEANEIRESILDGSYRFCKKDQCPYLTHIADEGRVVADNPITPIFSKDNLPSSLKKKISEHYEGTLLPSTVHFTFDLTCNLKCPSCRVGIITSSSSQMKQIEATIQDVENTLAKNINTLYITGSGDPFASPSFRKFLRNFNAAKYPKLTNIHLHTNATLWTPKMWDSMKNVHSYIKTCEISIDAANKDTYENYTRLGGDWDKLLENLKFISTIKNLKLIRTSFVVQASNYKEMEKFYNLMISIFGNKVNIFFSKIANWGTYSNEEYLKNKVWDSTHLEHENFLEELGKVLRRKQVTTNMQDLLTPTLKLI